WSAWVKPTMVSASPSGSVSLASGWNPTEVSSGVVTTSVAATGASAWSATSMRTVVGTDQPDPAERARYVNVRGPTAPAGTKIDAEPSGRSSAVPAPGGDTSWA